MAKFPRMLDRTDLQSGDCAGEPNIGADSASERDMDRRPSFSERPTVPCPPRSEVLAKAGERDRVHPRLRDSGMVPVVGERRGLFRVRAELDISIGADSHFFTASSVNLCPG